MVEQARERAIEEGLEEKVAFQVADALELPLVESTFGAGIDSHQVPWRPYG